ncbi:MAG: restriction endonuclease subunit S [Clostridia bacterium]|nr:restriction endonuclease subunit S [Clostridia bacterium]
MKRLEEVCDILDSKRVPITASDRIAGPYPYYGANGVQDYVADYLFDDELVLLAEDGGNFGSTEKPIAYRVSGKCWVNNHAHVLKPKPIINVDYLCYSLMFYNVSALVNGATRQKLTQADMRKMQISVPSMKEQLQIVNVLDKVSDLIALRKQQLAKLDELVKSRFVEMFGDLHSTNFPKCKMGNICGIKHGYAFSGEFFTEEDNNILLVTPGNFKVGGGFQEKRCKFFTGEYSKEYVLNGGDLIVTMTDLSKNMDTLGYSAIVPCTDRVYLHNQRIGLFVDMSEIINRIFLMYFMQTNDYRDNIIASATGSTVHHTSPSKILDCDVFVPPMELQEKFAAFVEQTDKSKSEIQTALTKLETLKKALMQQYFR